MNPKCLIFGHKWPKVWRPDSFTHGAMLVRWCERFECNGQQSRVNPRNIDPEAREAIVEMVAREIFEIVPQMRDKLDENGERIPNPDYEKTQTECCSYWCYPWTQEPDPDAPTWDELECNRKQDFYDMANEFTWGGLVGHDGPFEEFTFDD